MTKYESFNTVEPVSYGPAIVQGSERQGVAIFIEDERGDLVDIEYLCVACAWGCADAEGALRWLGFDFGDGGAYCSECGQIIEAPREWDVIEQH